MIKEIGVGEEVIYTMDNPAIKQLCEDIKNDPRLNITAEEAIKRLNSQFVNSYRNIEV